MISSQLIAYFCIVVGLSAIAGWVVAFRNRPYLGLVGLAFLSLAAYLGARAKVEAARIAGLPSLAMSWVEIGALVVCAALFVAATIAAVQESRRRLAEVREHFRAAEEGFVAMMEAERQRREEQCAGGASAPGGQAGEQPENAPDKGNEP